MDSEDFTGGQSSKGRAFSHIHILVVDDDPLCLTITESMLRKHNYGVVTVNHPVEALSTLQLQKGLFNLVITDIYMPEMNGFELLERIKREFRLPVVMMSADNKDTVIIRSLEIGASFYLVKPINANDLKNLWQFAINSNETHLAIDRVGRFRDASCVGKPYHEGDSIPSINEGFTHNEDLKREAKGKKKVHEEKEKRRDTSNSFKREKLNWTFALHNRFVEAIRIIGYKKAVPKNILKVMNVPGLTRNNVASHLQKYRIFLSKVASSSSITSAPKGTIDRALKTNFASGISMSVFKNSHDPSPQLSERKQMMTLPNPRFQMGPNGFTNRETSSSTFSKGLGYGQPQISYKPTTVQKNPFHHAINIGGTRNIELLNCFNSTPSFRYNNNGNLRHQNPGLQMGFSGAGTFDGDHDIHSLMIRNHNGNMSSTPPMSAVNHSDWGQDVFTRFGFVSENQRPPTSSNLTQPENTLAQPIPPLPVPLCQQESGVEVRGEDNNKLLNQMMDTSPHQPFTKDDLDDDFLKWVKDQSIDQKEGGQEHFMDRNFSISLSGAEEDSLQEAQLNHNQQQGGALDPTFSLDSCGIDVGLQEAQNIHNQQECEKDTANPNLISSEFELDDDFFQFDQTFNQHQGDKKMSCPTLYIQEFQQDDFFPRFHRTANNEQTHVEIINSEVYGTYHFNKNSSEDHSCPDQDGLQVILESFSGSGQSSEDNNCLGWF